MRIPQALPARWIPGALAVMSILAASTAAAQSSQGASPHNRGALAFSGGIDAPSIYFFRGIRQERDAKITVQPFGELRVDLSPGAEGGRRLEVAVGVWNSLQTGSSGLEGPSRGLHYEEDFYATATLGVGKGLDVSVTFAAEASPNSIFDTRKEARLLVSHGDRWHPSALVVLELNDAGQADHGSRKGTYLGVGVRPSWALMRGGPSVAVPVDVGLSLKDYYEGRDGDHRFGFLEVGGQLTLPLKLPERFGSWDVHGGASWLLFGDSTKALNIDQDGNISNREILWTFGVGVVY